MGLTSDSTGRNTLSEELEGRRPGERLIALAGNPNVGKSTLFNTLTGMDQHTGNWAGKTVSSALGRFEHKGQKFLLADIPGAYSLIPGSPEEKGARDVICFEETDGVVVVCDGVCLERSLNLVFQILETGKKVLVCVNLMDQAKSKGISIDTKGLADILGVPVSGISAREGIGIGSFCDALAEMDNEEQKPLLITYNEEMEEEIGNMIPMLENNMRGSISLRWAAVRLLCDEEEVCERILSLCEDSRKIAQAAAKCRQRLIDKGYDRERLCDCVTASFVKKAEETAAATVKSDDKGDRRDRRIDRILTSRITGIPIMLGILGLIFWITLVGANYPSQLLSGGLFYIGEKLERLLNSLSCPDMVTDMIVNGVYRVLAWVVSVMLPPMAIFFPLFTILEDVGYLPRAAFMLDRPFCRCGGCGKQSLTMAMGLGCNAAGVTGCRIIDSPRERLTAILTNNFMPCNGRFPTLIVIISMFFTANISGWAASFVSAVALLGFIVMGMLAALLVSFILSKTILKGKPSSFVLELPPYRMPKIGSVIIRSVFDRTIFVLGRACAVAAPAGLLIWLLANITVGENTLLMHMSYGLDPLGHILGMDGVILLGFILGFPANEIVVPIMLMCYMSAGTISEIPDSDVLKNILVSNGWNTITAFCTAVFTMFHFPCSTTCLTIKKETGSIKYTLAAMAIPTLMGCLVCFLTARIVRLI